MIAPRELFEDEDVQGMMEATLRAAAEREKVRGHPWLQRRI